jgi:hypothetical protein
MIFHVLFAGEQENVPALLSNAAIELSLQVKNEL